MTEKSALGCRSNCGAQALVGDQPTAKSLSLEGTASLKAVAVFAEDLLQRLPTERW